MDRGRRVLYSESPLTRLEPLVDRISILTTMGFGAVFGTFAAQGSVCFEHRPVQSTELVEIYLEPSLSELEPVVRRIGKGNT